MDKYNPKYHHRRSIRLKSYDYAQAGAYFITICCQERACLFGKITNGEMVLNDAGQMIEPTWIQLTDRFANIALHEFVVMPNHFHGILQIVGATLVVAQTDPLAQNDPVARNNVKNEMDDGHDNNTGRPQGAAPTDKTVGDMMGAFKSITTVEYIRGVKLFGWQTFNGKLWQRNYYEHIIRTEQSYHRIAEYIINNPSKWAADMFLSR